MPDPDIERLLADTLRDDRLALPTWSNPVERVKGIVRRRRQRLAAGSGFLVAGLVAGAVFAFMPGDDGTSRLESTTTPTFSPPASDAPAPTVSPSPSSSPSPSLAPAESSSPRPMESPARSVAPSPTVSLRPSQSPTPARYADITITPTTGPPGTQIRVFGTGFTPGGHFVVEFRDRSGDIPVSSDEGTVDDNGEFTAMVTANDSCSATG